MTRYAALLLSAIDGAGAFDEIVLHVGNPLHPWNTGTGDEIVGELVLDTNLCFSSAGTVGAVAAHVAQHSPQGGTWPSFAVLQPRGGTRWAVARTVEVWQVVGWAPARMLFREAMLVLAGECLGWHRNVSSGFRIASVSTWQRPGGPPRMGSEAVRAVSAGAASPEPPSVGDELDFLEIQHVLHSIRAEFQPSQSGFMRAALTKLEHGPRQEPDWQSKVTGLTTAQMQTVCWRDGFAYSPSDCCVPAGEGNRVCFKGALKLRFEDCCSEEIVGPALAWTPAKAGPFERPRFRLVDPSGAPQPLPEVTVDLFVRTYKGKRKELDLLLESAAVFWPASWGVVVVLDANSPGDKALCRAMPSWVRCKLLERPPFYADMKAMPGTEAMVGMLEKEWGECWADRHSTADFIAVIDSDVVFTSFVLPQLLFEPGATGLRPIVMGHSTHELFTATVSALRLRWAAEFMDNFPLVIHRSHFQALREFVVRLHGVSDPSMDPFDAAFLPYLSQVFANSIADKRRPECICFHSMMGSFLYRFHQDAYSWSIRHGHVTSLPVRHTCPRLRVAHHVAYWGMDNWMARYGYKYKQLKFETLPAQVADQAYRSRCAALVLAGMCAVRWAQSSGSPSGPLVGPDGKRRPMLISVNSSWEVVDDGMQDVHRDLCTQGLGLMEGRAGLEDRLLGRTFPAERPSLHEVAHCGGNTPERLLVEYRRLMASFVFVP